MAQRTLRGRAAAQQAQAAIATPQVEVIQGAAKTGSGSVSGNRRVRPGSLAGSAQVFSKLKRYAPSEERHTIAQPWQIEMYRFAEIIGEARYAAVLFSNLAARAEIGISEAQAMVKRPVWIEQGPEVDALAELAPSVRDRTRLIRDYMLHWTIAGECYLIARERRATDPGYVDPPLNPDTGEEWTSWDDYLRSQITAVDMLDPDFDAEVMEGNPNIDNPIWEIVAVTELRRLGRKWEVRHDEDNWYELRTDDPIIRMWNPNPKRRREAWSSFMAMEDTLREIEWFTKHIFTQVRSRLMAAGVWFLPDNLTFPPPPPDAVEGGAEAIAAMNEAELFMVSLAHASMGLLDGDTVAFPSVVMADPVALQQIDQKKLIQFWSDLDDKAMTMRSDAVRRFALGMDLPPEQVIGSSGIAVTGSSGSAGSVNHWGVWANEEQTITAHIEPALDAFTGTLTVAFLRLVVPDTMMVVAYDTSTLRLRQDRSQEAIKLYEMGLLDGETTLRECGFDPESNRMSDKELARWVLIKAVSGSWNPEQMGIAAKMLGAAGLDIEVSGNLAARGTDGKQLPSNNDGMDEVGPPKGDHDHNDAVYTPKIATFEMLVLRALEKNGNKLLNDGKRGRERDRKTPAHAAHVIVVASGDLKRTVSSLEFDFSLAETVLPGIDVTPLRRFCADLTNSGAEYSRKALIEALDAQKVAA